MTDQRMGRHGWILLVAALVGGCATASPKPPGKTVGDYYLEAHDRHYADLRKWLKGLDEMNKCHKLVITSPEGVRPCLEQLPPPETILPKDRVKDESLTEYMERKDDEWPKKLASIKVSSKPGTSTRASASKTNVEETSKLRDSVRPSKS